METADGVGSICQSADEPVVPIKAVGADFLLGGAEVSGNLANGGEEGNQGIKDIASEGKPGNALQVLNLFFFILVERQEAGALDADGTELSHMTGITVFSVAIIFGALEMRGEHVFYIHGTNLFLRHHAPGDVIGIRGKVCIFPFITEAVGIQGLQHIPGSGSVIHMVRIGVATEGVSWIEFFLIGKIQMMLCDKFL